MTALDGDWVFSAVWWRERGEVVASHGPVARPMTVTFEHTDEGPRATGFAGCNRYFGPCTVGDGAVTFGPLAATRMACADDELNRQEMALFDALGEVVAYRIEHGSGLLLDAHGAVRAVLSRP